MSIAFSKVKDDEPQWHIESPCRSGAIGFRSARWATAAKVGASSQRCLSRRFKCMACRRSSARSGRHLERATRSSRALAEPPLPRFGRVLPNPSLKGSTNGGPPGPGRWYAVHFNRPGPGALPLVPPQLER